MSPHNLLKKMEKAALALRARFGRPHRRPPRHDLNCTHYRDCDNPLEEACAEALARFPDEERLMLELRHGLTGKEPMAAARIASMAGISLVCCLTIGDGAELRIRNNRRCREMFAALLRDTEPQLLDLADRLFELHLSGAGRSTWRAETQAWLDALPPLRRLAVARLHDDGLRGALREALLRRQGRLERRQDAARRARDGEAEIIRHPTGTETESA